MSCSQPSGRLVARCTAIMLWVTTMLTWRLPPEMALQWATRPVGRSSRSMIEAVLAGNLVLLPCLFSGYAEHCCEHC